MRAAMALAGRQATTPAARGRRAQPFALHGAKVADLGTLISRKISAQRDLKLSHLDPWDVLEEMLTSLPAVDAEIPVKIVSFSGVPLGNSCFVLSRRVRLSLSRVHVRTPTRNGAAISRSLPFFCVWTVLPDYKS